MALHGGAAAAADIGFQEVYDFLVGEAALLDAGRFRDWLGLLSGDIDYRIPIRLTRARGAALPAFSEESFHMIEDHDSIRARIDRFDTGYAWSQDPPPRTRRFVSNVRILGREADALAVASYILFTYARADAASAMLTGEREDVLRVTADGLRIARRVVLLDHTYLPTENLATFL